MPRPRKVVLPDGLVHVVCVVVDGILQDPHVLVDGFDAQAVSNQIVVAASAGRTNDANIQIGTYKVRVVPEGKDPIRDRTNAST